MKRARSAVLIGILAISNTVVGQQTKTITRKIISSSTPIQLQTIKTKKIMVAGDENLKSTPQGITKKKKSIRTANQHFQILGYSETQIGTTTYDYQTNSSSFDRIAGDFATNKWAAVWTFSTSTAGGWPDRGTGYNYFNGSSWGPQPSVRLENVRTGWPNLVWTGSGFEVSIAHDPANNRLVMMRRQIGTGQWTQINMDTITSIALWPRLAVGGSDGNTLHLIGLTTPSAFGGTPYQGMDGALLYCRSLDGGLTWDIVDALLPGIDSTHYPDGIGGDSYAIDARGNVVAIILDNLLTGIQVWKSVDNGLTWQFYEVLENYRAKYGNPSPNDTIYTGDESVEVIIDTNNKVHAFWGEMIITNYDSAQGTLSYFPFIDGIDYWNEDMGNYNFVEQIAYSWYTLGSVPLTGTSEVGAYRLSGLSTHPTAAIDESTNCIYLIYDGLSPEFSGAQYYRHILGVRSCDGGCTWTEFIDLTYKSIDVQSENVYPTVYHRVDTALRILFQRDYEPGTSVGADQDPIGTNYMIFSVVTKNAFDTISGCNIAPFFIYPQNLCVGTTDSIVAFCSSGNSYQWGNGSTTPTLTISGPGEYQVTVINSSCTDTVALSIIIDTTNINSPINTQIYGPSWLCPGNNAVVGILNPTSGVVYVWSNGTTGTTTTVNDTITYYVTATNCAGGQKVDSIKISPPPSPQVTITGPDYICGGGTVTLSAVVNVNAGITYIWGNGATTSSTSVNSVGTYCVTVTNCAGATAIACHTVTTAPPPTVTINASAITACEGNIITLTAQANGYGPFTYNWSNSATDQSIQVSQISQSGAYSVTVTDQCGATANAGPVNVSIYPVPAPVISSFKTNDGQCGFYVNPDPSYVSYQWYVNNNPAGQNNDTLLLLCSDVYGKQVNVVVTNNYGCSGTSATLTGIYEPFNSTIEPVIFVNQNNEIEIISPEPITHIRIENITGKVIYSASYKNTGHVRIPINNYTEKLFIIVVETTGSVVNHKILR